MLIDVDFFPVTARRSPSAFCYFVVVGDFFHRFVSVWGCFMRHGTAVSTRNGSQPSSFCSLCVVRVEALSVLALHLPDNLLRPRSC